MNPSSAVMDGGPDGATQSSNSMANSQPAPAGPSSRASTASQTSRQSSAANSMSPSPMGSRDVSPTRHPRRSTSSSRLSNSRSRKNSQQDLSPSRLIKQPLVTGLASAARVLSATTTPTLLPTAQQDTPIQAPTPVKPTLPQELKDNPRWPVSPRLRSPSPILNKPTNASRVNEVETPLINVQRPTPSPQPADSQLAANEGESEDPQMPSGIRTPARGPLETVQEVSQPNSPSQGTDNGLLEQIKEKLLYPEHQSDTALHDVNRTLRARPNLPTHESGSDSSAKVESRRTASVPPPLLTRHSSISSKQAKPKPETSKQTMTVETETVPSIPQMPLSTGTKVDGANGTLKAKPSTETIRPKKEKKKTTRKQPAVVPGTVSSKADIFEANIASAVDEANTSDSEETFVYDSNPPDNGGDRATRRFHSRTPSATSMASQADRQNLRSIYGVLEGVGPGIVPKKSMKFANTFSNGNESLTPGEDDGKGTGRSIGGSARGTVRQHHHIGRWGRQPGNGHASLFDNESPFPAAARPKIGPQNGRQSPVPPSPRSHYSARTHLSTKRSAMQISSSYDLDDTTGADDERTPLLENGRSGRSGRFQRRPHNLRQAESQTYTRRSSYLNRFAACLVLTMMFLLVITGAIGFMFATSQPMSGIEIVSIQNVVTSEQVLMFDITVKAHNPNIVVVTIDKANLEIFAKSEYAGADSDWWETPDGPKSPDVGIVRPMDDPINDPPTGGGDDDDSKPNVLLGRITEFDSPLTFEGSLFHQGTSSSTGELQLAYPGNGTSGGSKRWERIYQKEFDIIIKGVVKYSLPLSAQIRTATVSGRTTVKPNSANDPSLEPNSTLTRK